MLAHEIRGPSFVDAALLEAIAEHAHAARFGEGVAGLAAGQGLTLARVTDLPRGFGGLAVDDVAVVQARRDGAEELLAALHEIAHALLARLDHSHADVWRLALALGAPQRVARMHAAPLDLAASTGLPALAAELRLRILLNAA